MNQFTFALMPARVQSLLQRIEHEVGLHRTSDPPAHDMSREDVDDEGDVDEALPGRDVGEIGHPQVVRAISLELPVDPIQRVRRLGIRYGGALRPSPACPTQPTHQHRPLEGAARHSRAFSPQLAPDLVGAADLQVLFEHPLHLGQ